ncbi:MAG: porin [Glaciimonas sp.]|nr:porin [Glaciimonas sp.]
MVFIGAGAAILRQRSHEISQLGVALAFGLSVTCLIGALPKSSGAHLNPVVTLSLCATGKCSFNCLVYYSSAQVIGACLASAALYCVFGPQIEAGTTKIAANFGLMNGFLVETILSFFLVLSILRSSNAFIVGVVVFLGALVGGTITGVGMNPARSFGPSLFSNRCESHCVYWLAPLSGALLAILIFFTETYWQEVQR